MRILVIGGGGREHAIAEQLRRSRHRPELLCAPGNAGTAAIAENAPVLPEDVPSLVALARDQLVLGA